LAAASAFLAAFAAFTASLYAFFSSALRFYPYSLSAPASFSFFGFCSLGFFSCFGFS